MRNGVNHQKTTTVKTISIRIVLAGLMKSPVQASNRFGAYAIGIKINVCQLMSGNVVLL